MKWDAKCRLIRKVAAISAELLRIRSDAAGNIYQRSDSSVSRQATGNRLPAGYLLDRMVCGQYFWEKHISLDIPRGPFWSSAEWLHAILAHKEYDCEQAMQRQKDSGFDSDSEEEVEETRKPIRRHWELIPQFFPPTEGESQGFALCYDGLDTERLMVNASGQLTALAGWDCASVLPLWKVCQLPDLLVGKTRIEALLPGDYERNDDGTTDILYNEDHLDYELTHLREVFFVHMELIEPEWMETYLDSKIKADFGLALNRCDEASCQAAISKWLDDVTHGNEYVKLHTTLMAGN